MKARTLLGADPTTPTDQLPGLARDLAADPSAPGWRRIAALWIARDVELNPHSHPASNTFAVELGECATDSRPDDTSSLLAQVPRTPTSAEASNLLTDRPVTTVDPALNTDTNLGRTHERGRLMGLLPTIDRIFQVLLPPILLYGVAYLSAHAALGILLPQLQGYAWAVALCVLVARFIILALRRYRSAIVYLAAAGAVSLSSGRTLQCSALIAVLSVSTVPLLKLSLRLARRPVYPFLKHRAASSSLRTEQSIHPTPLSARARSGDMGSAASDSMPGVESKPARTFLTPAILDPATSYVTTGDLENMFELVSAASGGAALTSLGYQLRDLSRSWGAEIRDVSDTELRAGALSALAWSAATGSELPLTGYGIEMASPALEVLAGACALASGLGDPLPSSKLDPFAGAKVEPVDPRWAGPAATFAAQVLAGGASPWTCQRAAVELERGGTRCTTYASALRMVSVVASESR